jgi:capsular exopolysaccharide synthesis family protein
MHELVTDIPLSAPPVVPGHDFALSTDLALISQPEGHQAEVFRSLRAQIIERHVKRGRRGFAVCAAGAGVGRSFLAANLAVAFARAGARTLLIDADMRAPAIHRFVTAESPAPGLAQVLEGQAAAIQPEVIPNLSLLYSGGARTDALERLSGASFPPFMAMCLRDFDITICDTPPANLFADALHVASATGDALVVLRKHKSFIEDTDVLLSQLQAARSGVIGCVLNEW